MFLATIKKFLVLTVTENLVVNQNINKKLDWQHIIYGTYGGGGEMGSSCSEYSGSLIEVSVVSAPVSKSSSNAL